MQHDCKTSVSLALQTGTWFSGYPVSPVLNEPGLEPCFGSDKKSDPDSEHILGPG